MHKTEERTCRKNDQVRKTEHQCMCKVAWVMALGTIKVNPRAILKEKTIGFCGKQEIKKKIEIEKNQKLLPRF